MTDPNEKPDLLAFTSELNGGRLLPYQQELIDQLSDPQVSSYRSMIVSGGRRRKSELTRMIAQLLPASSSPPGPGVLGTHPSLIIFDEATDYPRPEVFSRLWPRDETAPDPTTFNQPAEPATRKERERRHWTRLNGGSTPWKARRGKHRK